MEIRTTPKHFSLCLKLGFSGERILAGQACTKCIGEAGNKAEAGQNFKLPFLRINERSSLCLNLVYHMSDTEFQTI